MNNLRNNKFQKRSIIVDLSSSKGFVQVLIAVLYLMNHLKVLRNQINSFPTMKDILYLCYNKTRFCKMNNNTCLFYKENLVILLSSFVKITKF